MDFVAAVRAYAEAHYEEDGWDFLVECWEDADIAAEIGAVRSAEAAIARCRRALKTLNDHRAEVRATADW